MSAHLTARHRALIGAVVIAVGASAGASGSVPSKPDSKQGKSRGVVRVATTGNHSERVKTIPITKRADAGKRVVMSMGPRRLPGLHRGDRLKLNSEVQFTLNCPEPLERCVGPPYRYDPDVTVQLVLARGSSAKGGLALGSPTHATCRQRRPREHHCVIVNRGSGIRIRKLRKLPCKLKRCFVNLVVSAHNPKAGRGEKLLVGGNKPDGRIPQDRGRINAILFHPGKGRYARPKRSRARLTPNLPLDFERHVVYSQKVRNLQAGEQLAVDAKAVTDRRGLPYSVRTSSQLVLADSRGGVEPGPLSSRVGGKGEIGESNGFNCTRNVNTCTTRKVGVLRAARSARRRGKPRPVFVNLVMIVGAKRVNSDPDDRYRVRKGGRLAVTRYRKPRR